MSDNVIRFPGYLEARQSPQRVFSRLQTYKDFKAMVRDLSGRDRERTKQWHLKREGRSNDRAMILHYSAEALQADPL
jgi:hypothetical protein